MGTHIHIYVKKGDLASAPWLMKLERIGEVMPGETGPPYFMVIGLPDGTPDGGGSVAARGMPESARQLELWAPDVLISLLPQNKDWLRRVTEMLGIRWYYRPIGPICNTKKAVRRQDLMNFTAGVFEVIAELQKGRKVLAQCIQGLHWTEIFGLLLLVARGYTVRQALEMIRRMRSATWYELSVKWSWKNRPKTLMPKALVIMELVKNGWGDEDVDIPRGFEAERRTGRHKRYSASWDCRRCSRGAANYPNRYTCRKCHAPRPIDTLPSEAAQFRDTIDRQRTRVKRHRPDIVVERFGVGRGCQLTQTARDTSAFLTQIGLSLDSRQWLPSRRFFRNGVKVLEYPGSENPPSHDHMGYCERVDQLKHNAAYWCNTHRGSDGFNPRAPKQDFRELVMDVMQQTIDACCAESYYVGDQEVDSPHLPSMLKDTQGQEFYVGANASLRGGTEEAVDCQKFDRTGERNRTWIIVTHLEDTECAAAIKRVYDPQFPSEVVILVNASRKHCLGGWDRGAQAQEEKIAYKTNAVARLIDPHTWKPHRTHGGTYPLGEFGALVVKKIVVMRGPERDGYPFIPNPFFVDLCMAPAYKNLDTGRDGSMGISTRRGVVLKLEHALRAIIGRSDRQMGRPYLILTAWGCGASGNSPQEIADIMASLLCGMEFRYAFAGIVISICDDHNSVGRQFGGLQREIWKRV